jgi:hypothetical protein
MKQDEVREVREKGGEGEGEDDLLECATHSRE